MPMTNSSLDQVGFALNVWTDAEAEGVVEHSFLSHQPAP